MNKERFINNLTYLVGKSGKKIGEIENMVGVSQGYLSKISKSENNQWPSVETLVNLANTFQVSLDQLLFSKEDGMTASQRKLHEFIGKLIYLTEQDQLRWEIEDYNSKLEEVNYPDPYHPIFDLESGEFIDKLDFATDAYMKKRPLNSFLWAGQKLYLSNTCYKADLTESDEVYLFECADFSECAEDDDNPMIWYLLVINGNTDMPAQHFTETVALEGRGETDEETRAYSVEYLYKLVNNRWSGLTFSKLAESSIDKFLQKMK